MSHSRHLLRSWIILGYLLNLNQVSTQESSSLHFLREPSQRLYLQQGRTNQLDCSYRDNAGAVSHAWHRNELPVDERIVHSHPNGTLEFLVGDVTSALNSDLEGSYRCCITNGSSTLCGTAAHVAYPTLGPPVISASRETAVIGETFRLACTVEGDPSPVISWSKDEEDLRSDVDRVILLPNRAVQISQVVSSDQGSYICTAENLAGTVPSQAVDVTVTAGPSSDLGGRGQILNVTSRDVVGTVGQDALLECLVRDISNVGVHWTKGSENIPGRRWETIGHGNLLLKNLVMNDTGTYKCTSYDSTADKVQTEPISLTVQAAPVIIEVNERRSVVRAEALLVHFKCRVSGVPTPTVTWYRDGVRISLQGRFSQKHSTNLWVRNLDPGDSGLYQCYVSNPLGSLYTTYYLEVERSQAAPVNELRVFSVTSTTATIGWTLSSPPSWTMACLVLYMRLPDGEEKDSVYNNNGSVPENYTLVDLYPNSNYSISVRTFDIISRSFSRQATVYTATLESVPTAAPEIVNLTSTPTTLSARWAPVAPGNLNGALSYTVVCLARQLEEEECLVLEDPSAMSHTFTNLLPGVEYLVRIAVATEAGEGPYSLRYPRITPIAANCTAPGLVPLRSDAVNSSFVIFSWPAPRGAQRGLIRGYRLTVSLVIPNLGETRVNFVLLDADATSYNKSDAVPYSMYSIVFYPFGDCGEGPLSKSVIQMPEEVSIDLVEVVPHNIQTQALSADIIRIKWDPPVTEETILSYTIDYGIYGAIGEPTKSQISFSQEAMLLGLETYTIYLIRITANFASSTAVSELAYCRTAEGAPGSAPINVMASAVDSTTLNVSWDRPLTPNGEIVSYVIYYISSARLSQGWKNITKYVHQDRRSGLWFLLQGLQAETRYTIRVAAVTRPGQGPLSPSIDGTTLHTSSGLHFFGQATDIRKGILIGICLAILCIIVCVGLLLYHRRVSCCYPGPGHPMTVSMQTDVSGHYRKPHGHRRQEGYPLKRSRQHSWNISEREIESLVMRDLGPHHTERLHVQVHHRDPEVPMRGIRRGDRADTYLAIQEPCRHTSHRIPHEHPEKLDTPLGQGCPMESTIDGQSSDQSDGSTSRGVELGGGDCTAGPDSAHQGRPPTQEVEVICHLEPRGSDLSYSSRAATSRNDNATSAIPVSDGKEGLAPPLHHYQGLPPSSACRCSPYRRREKQRDLSDKRVPPSEADDPRVKCCSLRDFPLTDEGMKDDSIGDVSSMDGDSGLNGDFPEDSFGGCDTSPDFLERAMELLSTAHR